MVAQVPRPVEHIRALDDLGGLQTQQGAALLVVLAQQDFKEALEGLEGGVGGDHAIEGADAVAGRHLLAISALAAKISSILLHWKAKIFSG